jgi:hypothetical protein
MDMSNFPQLKGTVEFSTRGLVKCGEHGWSRSPHPTSNAWNNLILNVVTSWRTWIVPPKTGFDGEYTEYSLDEKERRNRDHADAAFWFRVSHRDDKSDDRR